MHFFLDFLAFLVCCSTDFPLSDSMGHMGSIPYRLKVTTCGVNLTIYKYQNSLLFPTEKFEEKKYDLFPWKSLK